MIAFCLLGWLSSFQLLLASRQFGTQPLPNVALLKHLSSQNWKANCRNLVYTKAKLDYLNWIHAFRFGQGFEV